MNPLTFIFIGRSGCGKGTQAELLHKKLAEKDPFGQIIYLETGNRFRDLIKSGSYTGNLSKEVSEKGDLQPDFIAVNFWSDLLIQDFKGTEHLILDGICRRLPEAMSFNSAMKFYDREVHIIHIDVSREWSKERLISRRKKEGRVDDMTDEDIERRLNWFETDTLSSIEYFRENRRFTVHDINGEQSIEAVYLEIMEKLKL